MRSKEQLLVELAATLSLLYRAALRFPHLESETRELPAAELTDERMREIVGCLGDVIGADNVYWTVVPIGEDAGEVLAGALTDDPSDIYSEVKEGLDLAAAASGT